MRYVTRIATLENTRLRTLDASRVFRCSQPPTVRRNCQSGLGNPPTGDAVTPLFMIFDN
jgi:hypothetical protein